MIFLTRLNSVRTHNVQCFSICFDVTDPRRTEPLAFANAQYYRGLKHVIPGWIRTMRAVFEDGIVGILFVIFWVVGLLPIWGS